MIPVTLATERLVLDQPVGGDVDAIAGYCTDPAFERFLTTPWPYRLDHAVGFVGAVVPAGWSEDREATWAIRTEAGGGLIGMIALRFGRHDLGYWIGRDHRGHGYTAEALDAVAMWAFSGAIGDCPELAWEAFEGNTASAAVARAAGFAFTGAGPAHIAGRDGGHPPSWHAVLRPGADAASAAASWPEATLRR